MYYVCVCDKFYNQLSKCQDNFQVLNIASTGAYMCGSRSTCTHIYLPQRILELFVVLPVEAWLHSETRYGADVIDGLHGRAPALLHQGLVLLRPPADDPQLEVADGGVDGEAEGQEQSELPGGGHGYDDGHDEPGYELEDYPQADASGLLGIRNVT